MRKPHTRGMASRHFPRRVQVLGGLAATVSFVLVRNNPPVGALNIYDREASHDLELVLRRKLRYIEAIDARFHGAS